jgi:hypothetical protein
MARLVLFATNIEIEADKVIIRVRLCLLSLSTILSNSISRVTTMFLEPFLSTSNATKSIYVFVSIWNFSKMHKRKSKKL